MARMQTDLLSPLSSPQLSVCGSVVKSMASCCSGCVHLLFLPLWACCCQIKPSTAPSDASSLKCVCAVTATFTCLRASPSIYSSPRLVPACLPISASPCLAVHFYGCPLICLVDCLLTCKINLGFNFWMSHAAILSCGLHSITTLKQRVSLTDFRNINIL